MNTNEVIILARKHVNGAAGEMKSSALVCLQDAIMCQYQGDLATAKERALKSLAYSVGVFHPDYRRARRPRCM